MFKKLFKSKTFISGLASALSGSVLTIVGQAAIGIPLMISGINTMLGRNATEKVQTQINALSQKVDEQSTVDNKSV